MAHTLNRHAVLVLGTVLAACVTGCATAHGPRQVDDDVTITRWSRVGELPPGAQISVATTRGPSRDRLFVSADGVTVTVVNLEAPSLPRTATGALRDLATRHPEYFAAMQGTSSFQQDGVRLGREGLFVAGQKIAAFSEVVETLSRDAVREIRGPVVARGSLLGTIAGVWLGFSAGVVPGLGGADPGAAWAFLAGSMTVGGWLGHHWTHHTEDDVVYRAP